MTRDDFLEEHLKLWKDTGVKAPRNELQSIQAWLRTSCDMTYEELKDAMRKRMILLMQAANKLHTAGSEAEDKVGIYSEAPELHPEACKYCKGTGRWRNG